MYSVIFNKIYTEPPFCEREILRYAGCREADGEISALLDICLKEIKNTLTYKVCYREMQVTIDGDLCDFGVFCWQSEKLAKNLNDCKNVLLFAATVGVGIDRLIAKYGQISPARALLFQAIGAERIEALCDAFCADTAEERSIGLRPRFSPGYGDLSLDAQRDIFSVLDCEKRIGLTLNDSLLMSPSKSVTAVAGILEDKESKLQIKCAACNKTDCTYRGTL